MMSEYYNDELYHYGVKGMKWGVRRYQNADGSLTAAGEKKYGDDPVGRAKLNVKSAKKEYNKAYNKAYDYSPAHPISQFTKKKRINESNRRWDDAYEKLDKLDKAKTEYKEVKKTTKTLQKQYGALEDAYVYEKKTNKKDLERAYGQLENSLTYNKRSNKKANEYAEKALVELDGPVFKALEKNREKWALNDCYVFPGAIQYFGPSSVCDCTTVTLQLEQEKTLASV